MACSFRIASHEHCTVCSGKAQRAKPFRWYRSKTTNHTGCARNTMEEPRLLAPNMQFISLETHKDCGTGIPWDTIPFRIYTAVHHVFLI